MNKLICYAVRDSTVKENVDGLYAYVIVTFLIAEAYQNKFLK